MFGHQNVSSPAPLGYHAFRLFLVCLFFVCFFFVFFFCFFFCEDCLRVWKYITMNIYWIISIYFREILFCEYEIHLTFHTYQTKQTEIIKQWQLVMVSLQLKPDIILGFR